MRGFFMNFIEQLINTYKGFGFTEWGFVILIFILLGVIFFYHKGSMMCKQRIEQYEAELSDSNKKLEQAEHKLFILNGGDIDED